MRLKTIRAEAFGAFRGEILELAPGMNIIHGPNESGKSCWHAALYSGLCGMRRGPGMKADDRSFRDHHKPWYGEEWTVLSVVELDDGTLVEIKQDLANRVDSRATDLTLGRDLSASIINEGSPDGSKWLGLDRRSFLATACVKQADLLNVPGDSAQLQEHLQRAASTAGKDGTAARAIRRLDEFRRETIGQDRRGSQRPLATARRRLQQAQMQLERAQHEHANYVRLLSQAEAASERARAAQQDLKLAEARNRQHQATMLRRDMEHFQDLGREIEHGKRQMAEQEHNHSQLLRRQQDLYAQLETADPESKGERGLLGAGGVAGSLALITLLFEVLPLAVFFAATAIALFLSRQKKLGRASNVRQALFDELQRVDQGIREAELSAERSRSQLEVLQTKAISLFGDDTPEEVLRQLDNLEKGVTLVFDELGIDVQTVVTQGVPSAAEIEMIRAHAHEAEMHAKELEGRTKERAANIPSVPEAEEELELAQAELRRVQELEEILIATISHLEAAQEKVHRTLAPVLAGAVGERLPRITAGRYREVTVDPENLKVQVKVGNEWRDATLLSQGTAEQVYLLLRVAMAEHLTKDKETCPLIFDDPTAQWDFERTEGLLNLLHDLSGERQVILFSQEIDVLQWAERNLQKPNDSLNRLSLAKIPVGEN